MNKKLAEINLHLNSLNNYAKELKENSPEQTLIKSVKADIELLLESNKILLLQNIQLETQINQIIDEEDEGINNV